MARHRTHVGIDIGHSVIRVVMVAAYDGGQFTVIGVGESNTEGIRKGHVFDMDALSQSLTVAIEQAEKMSGEPVEQAYISISDSIIDTSIAKGVVAISRSDGEIDAVDVERVLESAASSIVPQNYEILANDPLGYMVDNTSNVVDPIGMTGIRLEVDTHLMYANEQTLKQLTQAVLHTGVDVLSRTPSLSAAARSTLSFKQKEMGTVLLDMGSNSINMMIFMDGSLVHVRSFSVGCDYVTHDIAIGLKIEREVAERLKIEYGTCMPEAVNPRDVVDLSDFSPNYTQIVSRREWADIIEARMHEIFSEIRKELDSLGIVDRLPAGVTITGGGSKLPGVIEYARDTIGLPTQYGFPTEMLGLADKIDDPAFTVVVGLILDGAEKYKPGFSLSLSPKDIFRGVQSWYKAVVQGQK